MRQVLYLALSFSPSDEAPPSGVTQPLAGAPFKRVKLWFLSTASRIVQPEYVASTRAFFHRFFRFMLSPPAPDFSPDELVARCRDGDRAAFDEIVQLYGARLHRLCFHALGDEDEAADAAQDALVRAWRGLPNFRGESALSTWLHRIALNVVHDRLAKRKREPLPFSAAPLSNEDDEPRETQIADSAPSPESSALARERQQAVRCAMAQLSADHRSALITFDIEGRSYEEAAAILNLPMGTLKSRLSRARLALRELLLAQRELFEP